MYNHFSLRKTLWTFSLTLYPSLLASSLSLPGTSAKAIFQSSLSLAKTRPLAVVMSVPSMSKEAILELGALSDVVMTNTSSFELFSHLQNC